MTEETLKRANEIKAELELIGKVLQLVPLNDGYGCRFEIYTGDREALAKLVLKHKDEFKGMLILDKNHLEKELDEL